MGTTVSPSRSRRIVGGAAVAGGLGFEPRKTESESAVIPFHHPPIRPARLPKETESCGLMGGLGCERGHRGEPNIAAGRFAQPAPNEGRARRLAGFALPWGRVPPGARAGHQPVVSLEHLHRLANAIPGELPAHRARLVALLRREPSAFMPPEAWADPFLRRPVAGLD